GHIKGPGPADDDTHRIGKLFRPRAQMPQGLDLSQAGVISDEPLVSGVCHPDGAVGGDCDTSRAEQGLSRREPPPVATEGLDAAIPGVGDIDEIVADGDAAELSETKCAAAAASPSAERPSQGIEDTQPRVAEVGDPETAALIERGLPRLFHP